MQGSSRQLGYLALIVGLNFFLGSSSGSMIDNSGHLGGLVVGLLLSLGMAPRWDVVSLMLPHATECKSVTVLCCNLLRCPSAPSDAS